MFQLLQAHMNEQQNKLVQKIACFACEIEAHKIHIQIIIKEVHVNFVISSHIHELNGI